MFHLSPSCVCERSVTEIHILHYLLPSAQALWGQSVSILLSAVLWQFLSSGKRSVLRFQADIFSQCMLRLSPPFLISLPASSSLKRLRRKSRLKDKTERPGYSISAHIFVTVSLFFSISFWLTSFLLSHIVCPARKEGIWEMETCLVFSSSLLGATTLQLLIC